MSRPTTLHNRVFWATSPPFFSLLLLSPITLFLPTFRLDSDLDPSRALLVHPFCIHPKEAFVYTLPIPIPQIVVSSAYKHTHTHILCCLYQLSYLIYAFLSS